MNREPVQFGKEQHLFGILHRVEHANPHIVLMWNIGLASRIGHFRICTDLADQFNALGYAVLRFDLHSLGDSRSRSEHLSTKELNRLDITEAMDYLQEKEGFDKFVLVGICSGGVESYYAAISDERIKAFAAVDGIVYRTRKFYFHYYLHRIFKLHRTKYFLVRKYQEWFAGRKKDHFDYLESVYPGQETFCQEIKALIARGCKMYIAYTGGFEYLYSYHDQFYDMLPGIDFKGTLSLDYFPAIDHLFTLLADRRDLFANLKGWLQRSAPSA